MTAPQKLNELLSYFTPSPVQFDAARSHRASIAARLEQDPGTFGMFETGSLTHGTGISIYSDVDYFASMKGTRPTPSTALAKVRDSLQTRFTTTEVRVSSPAVVCKFADGRENLEVVPAYYASDGYWIPDPKSGDWMKSNPSADAEYVTDINKKHDGGAKKLIRLLKAWKYRKGVPISSFYLEMRAAKYLSGVSTFILIWDLCLVLEELVTLELAAMNSPVASGRRINPCSSEARRVDALSKTKTAALRARRALEAHRAGKPAEAVAALELLFEFSR